MPAIPSYIHTDFDAEQAYLILQFLDQVKDLLWATYGSEIIERHRLDTQHHTGDTLADHPAEDFDEPIPF